MDEVTLLLEGGVQLTGTPTRSGPEQVSLLAQSAEVDGVMLREVTLQVGGQTRMLPWLYVPFARLIACGLPQSLPEDEAQARLSFLTQALRKSRHSSRGADEGLRAVEGE